MELKKATMEDAEVLFKWANDPLVRQLSFHSETIKWEDHINWFNNKMKSPLVYIFIAYCINDPVGMIRLEGNEDAIVINYSVASEHRGKGHGSEILAATIHWIKKNLEQYHFIIGYVKINNIPSQKAFIRNGFICDITEDYMRFSLKVR